MTTTLQVEVLSDAINSPVLTFPGRRFPGILIQGDTLKSISDLAADVNSLLTAGDTQEASETATELFDVLRGLVASYEQSVLRSGGNLPYPK